MRIRCVGSSVGVGQGQFSASYLINGRVAIDAGSIGFMGSLEAQRRISHVFLSHSHIDHIGSLPIFLDNIYKPGSASVVVHASEFVQEALGKHFFNECVWPDFLRLSREESPFVTLATLESGEPVVIDELQITPVELDHVVPTLGFLIEDDKSAIAIVSDTSPTDAVWDLARGNVNLKAVFLESAFPNALAWLAEKARHLTPALFLAEYQKLGREVPVIAVHIKPAFYNQVVEELQALGIESPQISESDREYEF